MKPVKEQFDQYGSWPLPRKYSDTRRSAKPEEIQTYQRGRKKQEEHRRMLEQPIEHTRKEKMKFVIANIVLAAFALTACLLINAEGLRELAPQLAIKLYRIPIPGFGMLRDYDGWNRLDYAHLLALVLIGLVNHIWFWLYKHFANNGDSWLERGARPWLFHATLVVAIGVVLLEAFLFFSGLIVFGGGAWGESSWFGPAVLTLIYTVVLIAIARWHNNFKYGG